MFETGVRQFRMAMGMLWGRRMSPTTIARLVDDALATMDEFGGLGLDARELMDSPFADEADQLDFANRSLRRTARRLAAQSPFYARRFTAAGVRPDHIDVEAIRGIPLTVKSELVEQPEQFRCADAVPYLATRTTGTTGRAAEIWMSRYEVDLWSAISALTGVLREELHPADVMQVHVSSRATASVQLTAAICRLARARCRVVGVVPPDEALDTLLGGGHLDVGQSELSRRAGHRGASPRPRPHRLPAPPHRLRRGDPLPQSQGRG